MTSIILRCFKCDKPVDLSYRCKFCAQRFCSEHRIPENHDCLGLAKIKESPKKVVKPVSHSFTKPMRRKRSYSLGFGSLEGKMNYILLAVTVAIFVLQMVLGSSFTDNYEFDPLHIEQKPWTFITSIFLHGGVNHLLVNMLTLFFFGTLLERKIGTGRFLFIYFLAGIVGNIGYLLFTYITGSYIPALGASGAIYGVFATLAIIDPSVVVYVYFVIPLRIIWALILFAVLDIIFINANTGIASAAHLAGVVIGLIYGWYLKNIKGIYEPRTYVDHL